MIFAYVMIAAWLFSPVILSLYLEMIGGAK